MNRSAMTAQRLRIVLIIGLFLIIILAGSAFSYMQKQLKDYAQTISQLNADAAAGNQNLATLRKLQTELDKEEPVITKTKNIVAESQHYAYQDQIIKDLAAISQSSGVTITSFTFSDPTAASTPTTPAATTPTTSPATTTISGLRSQTVTVAIKSPLPYDNLMNFIKAIELNPMKMQIASVQIAKESGSYVTSESFMIEVYVR